MTLERLAPEQFDTLPDIPEPRENPLLAGHVEQMAALLAPYREGKLHHALLFAGPRGIGKATAAFHLANHFLKHPRPEKAPAELSSRLDPASPLFRMVASGAHPSVLHLTRPFDDKRKVFRTAITAEEIKRVGRFLGLTSHDGSYRVVIIDPAEDMNRHAANALLKSLEEPPKRTVFILITHQPGQLLPTIRSRCQMIRFHPLGEDDLRAVLAAAGDGSEAADAAIFREAGGSARDAFLMSRYGGLDIARTIAAIVDGQQFDAGLAHRLADAVTGREQAVQFSIFNRALLDLIAAKAAEAIRQGSRGLADALAAAWQDAERTIGETESYNLDKRQHVVGSLLAAHGVVRA